MGIYVNPTGMSKEDWLAQNGKMLIDPPKWEDVEDGSLPICLVDNGPFRAAGVCFSKQELECFTDPTDPRSKTWFMVEVDKLSDVCGEPLQRYMNKQ
jgi:hypothetical protein